MIIVEHCGLPSWTRRLEGHAHDPRDWYRPARRRANGEGSEEGAGFRNTVFTPSEIEYREAKEAADRLGVKNILVSLSHTDSLAAASVVLQG
jgi:hypothetical protein